MDIPIYVTRPYGRDKTTGRITLSPQAFVFYSLLLWTNVTLWGLVGIYTALSILVGAIS